jgi:hypothetical protein
MLKTHSADAIPDQMPGVLSVTGQSIIKTNGQPQMVWLLTFL